MYCLRKPVHSSAASSYSPLAGGILHTLNPRLSPADLAYIVNHADDQILLVDDVLVPVWEHFRHEIHPRHVVVWGHGQKGPEGTLDYEEMIEPELASGLLGRKDLDEALDWAARIPVAEYGSVEVRPLWQGAQ